jgi:hypothetical protein
MGACQEGPCSESSEPLAGRLGAPHSEGIAPRHIARRGNRDVATSGSDGADKRCCTGTEEPGSERQPLGGVEPQSKARIEEPSSRHKTGQPNLTSRLREGQKQTRRPPTNAGSRLKRWKQSAGRALSEMPTFQPCWGKHVVRNDRETVERRHHPKPATRHCPTRLRGAPGSRRPYRDAEQPRTR